MTEALLFLIFVALVVLTIKVRRIKTPGMEYGERDNSDPPEGYSGLIVLTDHLSGRQYLSTPLGGLTPRLSASGGQLFKSEQP